MSTATTADAPAPAQTERQNNRINGTMVLEATHALTPDLRNPIVWFHSYYYDSGEGLDTIARKIGYDGGTLSKVFRGVYGGSLDSVVDAIVKFRALLTDRASVNKVPFIATELFKILEESCNALRTYQKMGFVYGESQVGKTSCLKRYAEMDEYNHGRTVYVEMPVGGTFTGFCTALAKRIKISPNQRTGELPRMIMEHFTDDMLLIVDETSRAAVGGKQTSKTLDFIRAIFDHAQCGVLLCGTNIFRDQMANERMEPFLRQMHRRVLFRRQLPDRPSRADLNAFAGHYALNPAVGEYYVLQKQVIASHGLGVWLTTLTAASRMATNKRQAMTWDHVVKAHAFLKRLEESPKMEE